MKNSSVYNPSREEVEKAVIKYLEDGGDIQKIQFNTNTPVISDFEMGLKNMKIQKEKKVN